MRERRHDEAWAKWKGLVAEQGASGESVAAFCRERGLPASQFFAWKKRLSQAAAEPFVAVQVARTVEPEPANAPASPAIEIRVSGRLSILVEPGFDADHLRAVLSVLETRA